MNKGKAKEGETASVDVIARLFEVIESRRGKDPETSHTAKLFSRGRGKICQKLGEEAVETVVAALDQKPKHVARESADLLYHLLVLWAEVGLTPGQVWAELEAREGISGIEEKKSRKD
ncbi:MAG: phosphoribosyl-ATP diphosphatase [Rhodospirillaceae bacterium]|nr:phosphoribosyl-ATP diphosphatase [Rhodospirillaceae bacterium]